MGATIRLPGNTFTARGEEKRDAPRASSRRAHRRGVARIVAARVDGAASMTHNERARALLDVVALLARAQAALDALAVGDTSTMPSELKHGLDAPKEAIRAYARLLYLGATPATVDKPATHP